MKIAKTVSLPACFSCCPPLDGPPADRDSDGERYPVHPADKTSAVHCEPTACIPYPRAFLSKQNQEESVHAISFAPVPFFGRHIEVDYHYCSEAMVNKICKIVYCPTADMKADGLTKPLGKVKHLISMDHLCVCPPPGGEEQVKVCMLEEC